MNFELYSVSNIISQLFILLFVLKIRDFKTSAWTFYLLANVRYVVATSLLYYYFGNSDCFTSAVGDVGLYTVLNIVGFMIYLKLKLIPKKSSWIFLVIIFISSSILLLTYLYLVNSNALYYMWDNAKIALLFSFIDITGLILLLFKRVEGFLLFAISCFSDFYYKFIFIFYQLDSLVDSIGKVQISISIIDSTLSIIFILIMLKTYARYLMNFKQNIL
ncbi:hypothetical protein ACFPDQ_03805 [Pseudofrancisella aestuarii]|uniref:Uncharacterized protein n=1 Tax=Pseudofrancisella aestuarii TaxID=2670347 RepID=A0ABV9TAM2_9GAMM|nr:hypothetical protein [Pseudofrancisella aestuarii]